MEPAPLRNVEIKARVGSDENFQRKVQIARNLTSSEGEVIVQKDVFFKCKQGRLKLRYLQNRRSQLVQYDRPDVTGPKLSTFRIVEIDEPEVLELILNSSNGALGVLKKTRHLFLHNNVRIHLDQVENLGNFLEFEVCMSPGQTEEDGQRVADQMMNLFQITPDQLMAGAYFDELRRSIELNQD